MKLIAKSALVLLLTLLIGASGAAALFAGQTATASSPGEMVKAAGAEASPQTAQEKQEKEKELQEQQKAIQAENDRRKAENALNEPAVKTYSLKFIGASEFMRSAKFYVYDSTGTESSLTVKIAKRNIPDFEALLKKLDVEKKNVQFQVYAILALKDDPLENLGGPAETKEITDKDLKRVLDEMKGIWNFKHYWVDSPSFLIAKDGSGSTRAKLVSRYDLELTLRNVQIRGDEPGKRIISVGEIGLTQKRVNNAGESYGDTLIDTNDITLKEKGYLVVGVSGMPAGWRNGALILVISAEIK
jgi:uncharacterized membrane protein